VFCIYESPEDGHRSRPKHVLEVIRIKLQILLRTEDWKKCLIGTRATGCITQKLRLLHDVTMLWQTSLSVPPSFCSHCCTFLSIFALWLDEMLQLCNNAVSGSKTSSLWNKWLLFVKRLKIDFLLLSFKLLLLEWMNYYVMVSTSQQIIIVAAIIIIIIIIMR
jgi:hypothetical protein